MRLERSSKAWKGDLGELELRENRDHPDNSIVEIGQNDQKSFGNLWRLAVIQTPVNAGVKNLQTFLKTKKQTLLIK